VFEHPNMPMTLTVGSQSYSVCTAPSDALPKLMSDGLSGGGGAAPTQYGVPPPAVSALAVSS
jgi:hypothetical protein